MGKNEINDGTNARTDDQPHNYHPSANHSAEIVAKNPIEMIPAAKNTNILLSVKSQDSGITNSSLISVNINEDVSKNYDKKASKDPDALRLQRTLPGFIDGNALGVLRDEEEDVFARMFLDVNMPARVEEEIVSAPTRASSLNPFDDRWCSITRFPGPTPFPSPVETVVEPTPLSEYPFPIMSATIRPPSLSEQSVSQSLLPIGLPLLPHLQTILDPGIIDRALGGNQHFSAAMDIPSIHHTKELPPTPVNFAPSFLAPPPPRPPRSPFRKCA